MRILYAHTGTSPYDHTFVNFLSSNNEVDLVSLDASAEGTGLSSQSMSSRVRFHRYDLNRYCLNHIPKTLMLDCLGIPILSERLSSLNPEILVSGWIPTYGFYAAISGFHPQVLLIWGSDILLLPKSSRLNLLKTLYALRIADLVVVDSLVQRNAAIGYGCSPAKLLSFPWAVDLDLFKPELVSRKHNRGGKQTILCARSHEPVYGVDYLLQAIPLVLSRIPTARFVLAGSGTLTGRYREFVRKEGFAEHVDFLGSVPHDRMPEIVSSCDVYVTPSLSDGSSATLLEAMACAKPCVGTDIPGNQEWIRTGINGILVPTRDPKALADALIRVLMEPGTAGELGCEARSVVERKANLKQNLRVFQEHLSELVMRFRSGP